MPCHKETHKDPQNFKCCPAEEARSAANQVVSHASAIALGWSCLSYEFQPTTKEDAWVRYKRPRGVPQMTYGQTIKRLLKCANIEVDSWHILAADRLSWKKTIAI